LDRCRDEHPGGGAFYGTLNNCIVYFNSAASSPNYSWGAFNYSCTTPYPGGTGNITNDPQFVNAAAGDYRLLSNSPCNDLTILEGSALSEPSSSGRDGARPSKKQTFL